MQYKYPWIEFLFGKVTLAIATVLLAIACTVMLWPLMIGSAIFWIFHTIVNTAHDKNIVSRLGRNHDRVQRRVTKLISDLGLLSKFEIWMIDIYLPIKRWALSSELFFVKRSMVLSRQLSVSLNDTFPRPQPEYSSGPFVECFEAARQHGTAKQLLWINQSLLERYQANTPIMLHSSTEFDPRDVSRDVYGVLCVSPLVDELSKNCLGILAIHVKPEPIDMVQSLGVLVEEDSDAGRRNAARRLIYSACSDIYGLLI